MKQEANTQEYNLEWKKHDEFFVSLNKKLDEISYIGEKCYGDINNLYEYFAKIKNLFNKHKAYIQDPIKMKENLISVQNALYNPNFTQDLRLKRPEAKTFQMQIFNRLQDILTEMIEDFTVPELIPKPLKVEKEPWADEQDSRKKAMYKTVYTMFENV